MLQTASAGAVSREETNAPVPEAVATLGAGGAIDSETLNRPIIGFIFSGKGLMYNLTFEGSKISRIDR
jgi:lipid-binding SYLF domain-containing protein